MLVPSEAVIIQEPELHPDAAAALRREGAISRRLGYFATLVSGVTGLTAVHEFQGHEYAGGSAMATVAVMSAVAAVGLVRESFRRQAEARGDEY